MAKKPNITALPKVQGETDAQWAVRMRALMRQQLEDSVRTEKGTARALALRLLKEVLADTPAPTAEVTTVAFDVVGEAGDQSA